MKIILLLALAAAVTVTPRQTPIKRDMTSDAEAQLIQREKDWNEAFKLRDAKQLDSICGADFVTTTDEGHLQDRAAFMKSAEQARVTGYRLKDLAARVYGDTGIVTGEWIGTITVDGEQASMDARFTDTFVRRDGRWWAVASQMTRMPAPDQ